MPGGEVFALEYPKVPVLYPLLGKLGLVGCGGNDGAGGNEGEEERVEGARGFDDKEGIGGGAVFVNGLLDENDDGYIAGGDTVVRGCETVDCGCENVERLDD